MVQWGSQRICHESIQNVDACWSRTGMISLSVKHSTSKLVISIHIMKRSFLHGTFKQQVLALVVSIEDTGNPFLEDTSELLGLDKRHVIDESVADSIHCIEALGQQKFREYQQSVISDHTKTIYDRPKPKPKTKQAKQIVALTDDIALFSRLYIVTKHRDCDMVSFFKHNNQHYPPSLCDQHYPPSLCDQHYPPSLCDCGKLRFAKKSDLLHIIAQESRQDPRNSFH